MKIILTPIDFSPVTPLVVDEAVKLAQVLSGKVALLHVARVPPATSEYAMDSASMAELTLAIERDADRQLTEYQGGVRRRGVPVESLRSTGSPAAVILEQSRALSADYIVMGSHGHTAFYELVMGGTASTVTRSAACPVVIVPARNKGKAMERRDVADLDGALAKS